MSLNVEPSFCRTTVTFWFFLIFPANTRPTTILPTNSLYWSAATCIWSGASSSTSGAGTLFRIASNSGCRSFGVDGQVGGRDAGAAAGVDDREVGGVVVGAEFDEQVEHQRVDVADARVRPVDLVDDDDRLEPGGERLLQHEPRLRQRPFGGVDEHERTVGHLQDALDLAAEVGVARACRSGSPSRRRCGCRSSSPGW